MSLRSFHIFFIVTALSLLGFLAYWSVERLLGGGDGQQWALAISSVGGLLLGIPYLGWFIRKGGKAIVLVFVIFNLYVAPSASWACAVCFGKSDNPNMGRAYSLGILVLLGFTFLILAALGMTIYRIESHRASHKEF